MTLTAQTLRERLHYDSESGAFTWRIRPAQRVAVGAVAGFVKKDNGYVIIKIDRRAYFAHRLAWLYMTGAWPKEEVDHKNRDRKDNTWVNLREVTRKQNQENRTPRHDSSSGVTGVLWNRRDSLWRATICIDGVKREVGSSKSLEKAVAIRYAAERQHQTHSPRVEVRI